MLIRISKTNEILKPNNQTKQTKASAGWIKAEQPEQEDHMYLASAVSDGTSTWDIAYRV